MLNLILANIHLLVLGTCAAILVSVTHTVTFTQPGYALCCLLLFLGYCAEKKHFFAVFLAITTTFLLSMYSCEQQQQRQLNYETLFNSYTLDVMGVVTDTQKSQPRQQLIINVNQFRTTLNQKWRTINASIIVYVHQPVVTEVQSTFSIGDTVRIADLTCTTPSIKTKQWLQHIHCVAVAFNQHDITLIHRPFWSLQRMLNAIKSDITQQLQQKLSPSAYELIATIFFGYTAPISKTNHRESFSWWGINHYLARAGIHLVVFLLILHFLFTLITRRFITKTMLIMVISIMYGLLSWHNIPFIRAFAVLISAQCCHILKIPINTVHLLNLVVMGYLLYCPMILCTLDFQLTFAITYGFVLLNAATSICKSYNKNTVY
jgi:hypothetical protein